MLALSPIMSAAFAPTMHLPTLQPRVSPMQIRAVAVDPHLLELPLTLLSAAADDLSVLSAADQVARASVETSPLDGIGVLFILMIVIAMLPKGDVPEEKPEAPSFTDPSITHVPTTVEPGWLTCDMRVPLPAYADLETACHLLNTVNGARWWLCASESYPNCLPSKDFSDYYKRPVFVCQVA